MAQNSLLTRSDILKEIYKCGNDPVYFIDTYVKITHKVHGLISFKTWDFQKDLIQDFKDYPNNIILKGRQLGVSTLTAAYCSWLMLFHAEKSIMVAATKLKVAANLVRKVKSILKNLPPFFEQLAKIKDDNKQTCSLTNGSEIQAGSKAQDLGRSEALSLLILDEAAHIENLDEMWTAAGPTLAGGGRCIAISTPKGIGNWFYNKCMKAETGENEFHLKKLKWDVHPERDAKWEVEERKKYSTREFAQEYELSFLASGDSVIEPSHLERIFKGLKDPIAKGGYGGNMWIWERHNPTYNYLVVSDVARGDGADFSTVHVINIETFEQVVEFKSKIEYEIFSKVLYDIGIEYGNAMIVVENNMIGFEVAKKLVEMKYPHVFFSEKGSHDYVAPHLAVGRDNVIPGFTTTPKTRPWIINKLEEYVRNALLIINSERTYNELTTFIWHNGKAEAQEGHNDDLVIPLAIACWVRDTALKESVRGLEYKKALLKSVIVTRTKFNTRMPGQIGFDKRNSAYKPIVSDEQRKWMGIYKG